MNANAGAFNLPAIKGRVAYIFDETSFDVDQIIGVENIHITDRNRLKSLAMQSIEPDFPQKVREGDVLVGGRNFGYGHPHMPPMIAMRALGISCVIAESYAPGYWREEMADGFPQFSAPGIIDFVHRWDEVSIEWDDQTIKNHTRNSMLSFEPFSNADLELIAAGGQLEALKAKLR